MMPFLHEIWTILGISFLMVVVPANSQRSVCTACTEGNGCETVRGILGITVMSVGYNPVVRLPAGACNVNITEADRSANHLAIKTVEGDYILNGQWMIDKPGMYTIEGSPVLYSRGDYECPGECIRAPGPVPSELIIQLLYHDRSPGVYYSYQIPPYNPFIYNKNNRDKDPDLEPRRPKPGYGELREPQIGSQSFEDPNLVSAVDKSEIETSTKGSFPVFSPYPSKQDVEHRAPIFSSDFTRYRPIETREESIIGKPANQNSRQALTDVTYSRGENDVDFSIESDDSLDSDDADFNVIDRDAIVYENLDDKTEPPVISILEKYSWKVTGYSECTRPCGGGMQETVFTCVNTTSQIAVDDSHCLNTIKPELEYRVCNIEACTPKWIEGPWSDCSRTCGQGQMTRTVTCQQRISATESRPLTDDFCLSSKPDTTRVCLSVNCYTWKIGDWTECSTPCGEGTKMRQADCVNELGGVVGDENCELSKPVIEESCDMGSCSRHWYHSKWSGNCLNNCDSGFVTRAVHCATDTGYVLPDSQCDISDKPRERETCRQGVTCGGRWFAGPWSKCSQSCGEGVKTRHIVCMKKIGDQQVVTSDDNCVDDEKPETTDTCTESDCGHTWFMTEWSKCSKSCGGGIKTRSVLCMQDAGNLTTLCDCSKSCGGGIKTRSVLCMQDGGNLSTLCDVSRRPENSLSCNTDKCWTRPRQTKKGCVNKYPNCHVVVQARLCRYWYYQRKCCASCSENLHSVNN